jgi:polyketide cyclase/dehydrase/lipid transport protein
MRDFEKSATIATSADRLFSYLADVRHLGDYFPKVLDAKPRSDENVSIVIDIDGLPREVDGWFRVDELRLRLQWGVPGSGYQGWLAVTPTLEGCDLTVSVQTPGSGYQEIYTDYEFSYDDGTEYELADTIESIRNIMDRHEAAAR